MSCEPSGCVTAASASSSALGISAPSVEVTQQPPQLAQPRPHGTGRRVLLSPLIQARLHPLQIVAAHIASALAATFTPAERPIGSM